MDDKLRSVFDELKSAIARSEADGVIDDQERAELRSLVQRIDSLLEKPGSGDHEGVTEQLEESAIRFEGNHPTVAAVLRSVVDTLTGYGI